MKDKVPLEIERYRIKAGLLGSDKENGFNGAFCIPYDNEFKTLNIIVSDEMGWDHVSVSLPNRCPTWEEMCQVKRYFFKPEETVIQYHPPQKDNISYHQFCLHLWREQGVDIKLPPSFMVGPQQGGDN